MISSRHLFFVKLHGKGSLAHPLRALSSNTSSAGCAGRLLSELTVGVPKESLKGEE
jgi:hypothetical protein